MAKGDRGSRGRKEYGSGSDHRRGTTYRDRDRADRNRDRYRERQQEQSRLAAEKKAREEAERKAKEEAERRAKEEAERRAKEEAERKAKIAQKKAESEAEKEAQSSSGGFSPMGGLSSYGLNASSSSPIGGRGVLAGMRSASNPEEREIYERSQNPTQYGSIHFRAPTDDEAKGNMYTNENAYSGESINENSSKENIARLTGEAIDEKQMQIARNAVSSPFGPAGKLVSEVVGWATDLFDSSTDWEKGIKEQIKSTMDGGSMIQNIGGAAQAGAILGSMKDVGVIKDIAPAILNPVAGAVIGVADDIVGLNNFMDKNKKYLEENGLLPDNQQQNVNRDKDSRDRGGVLAGMVSQPSPMPVVSPSTAESALPEFTWYEGDELNSNYGMGFKR